MSRRARWARSSHMRLSMDRVPAAWRFPEFWDRPPLSRVPSVAVMTQQVQYTAAGEGIELNAPDAVLTVKVDAAHTGGAYEVFEVDAPRGPATPLHRTNWPKAYYVLQGRMLVQVEDEGYDLTPGASVTIPPKPCTPSPCSARPRSSWRSA